MAITGRRDFCVSFGLPALNPDAYIRQCSPKAPSMSFDLPQRHDLLDFGQTGVNPLV